MTRGPSNTGVFFPAHTVKRHGVREEERDSNPVYKICIVLRIRDQGAKQFKTEYGAACSVVVKGFDLDPQGRWFDPRCAHVKICTAVWPLTPHSSGGMSPV